jgi:hypothetical protein
MAKLADIYSRLLDQYHATEAQMAEGMPDKQRDLMAAVRAICRFETQNGIPR